MLGWLLLALGMASAAATAGNTPCSGRKGGVSHCAAGQFVCNDGSISASKKVCAAAGGSSGARLAPLAPAAAGSCPCSSGRLCTGPRGGRYCLTPSGNKSYKPRG
ncbi:hypothetical protein [Stenotrophomonas rhizophila]|uniref:hypothetical protein n=1 Tax=Stenotrophomonas rhizophila TaxID=216778 RepID=UPI001E4A373A|nr:hypothetical protein [Stenotrophomonas rhizophila]